MKTWVVLNPKAQAGRAERIESALKKKFPASDVRFTKTSYPGHATAIARRAVAEHADVIVAVGGDGTIREVVNGVLGSRVAIGIIPAGTANDLAAYYHLPGEIDKAGDIILARKVRPADAIQVNGEYYITAGGLGLPSEVAHMANWIKSRGGFGRFLGRFLSSQLYMVIALWMVLVKSRRRNSVVVRSNGRIVAMDILSLTINNQPFLGKNFLVSPGAANDDGQLDVCLIQKPKGRLRTLMVVLKALSGKHVDLPCVRAWRTDRLTVEAEDPLYFLSDGEVAQRSRRFSIRIFPAALNVIVPAAAS
jgi:YegS/Rv2252/BmrU family lipid kinase